MIYVYAIVDAEASGGAWTCVRAGGVYAAVAEREQELAVDETALREHDATVREIEAKVNAILPARFGLALGDTQQVIALLESRAAVLAEALATVAGRAQMTLRLFRTDGASAPPRWREPGAASGTRYLEERAREAKLPELDFAREALGAWIKAERVERQGMAPLVGSAYHLVERADAAAYAAAVRQIAAGPFRVTASGPFPPYAFAPVLP